MNKRQRFFSAVQGQPVDRPPVTAWVHFQSDHLPGPQVAELHLQFLRAYDWDVLKVMNDFRYAVPEGVTTLADAASLKAYRPQGLKTPAVQAQLDCLSRLQDALRGEVPLLETSFEPFQQIVRNIGFSQAADLYRHRDAALAALEVVTEDLCAYMGALKARGIEGMFMSINGAIPAHLPRGASEENHELFQKPFAAAVLRAAEGLVRVLHVHGAQVLMERVAGYPCEVLSVSDRLPGNPDLAALRKISDKCLMGGIDETRITERALPEIACEIDAAIAAAGKDRLILAPGCTIPSFTSERNLRYLREYSRFPEGLP
ncbi:uroporphyrinogen decarboxylase family protein [Xylophilus sp. ASV27]|uniref:uroporphyrinogen decarboxylase family protein n=1 Tax=Xylophilus sp. ASV27 TaxID=2795129 RepID=UPI0018ECD6E5|nr:uroporphyrinogen decarboxylase family protein [Xylophilus sp. ASV27]